MREPSRCHRRGRRLSAAALLAVLASCAAGGEADAVRLETYDALASAEERLKGGDVDAALGILTPRINGGGNAHELALLHDLAAAALGERRDFDGVLRHRLALLALGDGVPGELAARAREALPSLYAATGRLSEAVEAMLAWQSETADPPLASFVFLAETYYRMEAYREAIPPLETAIDMADAQGVAVEEDWLTMLFAMLFERRRFEGALAVAERLDRDFPSERHRANVVSLKWKIARQPQRKERPKRPTVAPPPGAR